MVVYGYDIGYILQTWADLGVFAYLLPFLMIFAIVYGILNSTNLLGNNRGVQATVALAMGLLALQFDYVSNFYASIFPYAGIGIAIILLALIFLGFVSGDAKIDWFKRWAWFVIGAGIFVVVVFSSFSDFFWLGGRGYFFFDAWPAIAAIAILVGLMAAIVWGGGKGEH